MGTRAADGRRTSVGRSLKLDRCFRDVELVNTSISVSTFNHFHSTLLDFEVKVLNKWDCDFHIKYFIKCYNFLLFGFYFRKILCIENLANVFDLIKNGYDLIYVSVSSTHI